MCVWCVWGHMCQGTCMELGRWLVESLLSFYFHVWLGDWTQVIRPTSSGRKHLYPLSHLIAPVLSPPLSPSPFFSSLLSSLLSLSSCPSFSAACSPRGPPICYVGKDDLELVILQPAPITPNYSVLGIKPRPSCIMINYPTSPVSQILTSNSQQFKNFKHFWVMQTHIQLLVWDIDGISEPSSSFSWVLLGSTYLTREGETGLWSVYSHLLPALCQPPPVSVHLYLSLLDSSLSLVWAHLHSLSSLLVCVLSTKSQHPLNPTHFSPPSSLLLSNHWLRMSTGPLCCSSLKFITTDLNWIIVLPFTYPLPLNACTFWSSWAMISIPLFPPLTVYLPSHIQSQRVTCISWRGQPQSEECHVVHLYLVHVLCLLWLHSSTWACHFIALLYNGML